MSSETVPPPQVYAWGTDTASHHRMKTTPGASGPKRSRAVSHSLGTDLSDSLLFLVRPWPGLSPDSEKLGGPVKLGRFSDIGNSHRGCDLLDSG